MYCNLFIPPQPLLTCISPPTPPPNCFSQAKLLKDIATHLKEGSDLAKITGAVPGAAQLKQIRKELSSENPTSPISPEWDKMVRKRKGRGGAVTETRDGIEERDTDTATTAGAGAGAEKEIKSGTKTGDKRRGQRQKLAPTGRKSLRYVYRTISDSIPYFSLFSSTLTPPPRQKKIS